ncbi:hypothetical protein EXE58_07460 [Nocardioides seonyuensis]|uniref:Uncharacterized protein n=1 Tax=Nocardioides seonyuensis TaxID=2518371 RepID=A0A4P7IGU2_9ACTN|nr:hypothetical protein [Nocardioides seonyuensis]QBX55307.1 hypothetical protein EXE58_07460 [Nocardioides seonyuensis]
MHFGRRKTLIDRAHDYVDQVSDTVIPQLEAALVQAREKAGPALHDARDRARPLIAEGKARATETATIGAALAAEKAHAGAQIAAERAAMGRDLAAAKAAELTGKPEPKGSKLKKLLLIGGLAALGGFLFTKLKGKQSDSSNWQSSYQPSAPAPARTPASGAGSTATPTGTAAMAATADPLGATRTSDDVGGGAPGEAISDSVEEPHGSTTPDRPAEVIDVDDVPEGSDKS